MSTETTLGRVLEGFGKVDVTPEVTWVHFQLQAHQQIARHDHPGINVYFTAIRGELQVTLDLEGREEVHVLKGGDVLNFKGEAFISVKALQPSEVYVALIERQGA